jgi:hypothetical protein
MQWLAEQRRQVLPRGCVARRGVLVGHGHQGTRGGVAHHPRCASAALLSAAPRLDAGHRFVRSGHAVALASLLSRDPMGGVALHGRLARRPGSTGVALLAGLRAEPDALVLRRRSTDVQPARLSGHVLVLCTPHQPGRPVYRHDDRRLVHALFHGPGDWLPGPGGNPHGSADGRAAPSPLGARGRRLRCSHRGYSSTCRTATTSARTSGSRRRDGDSRFISSRPSNQVLQAQRHSKGLFRETITGIATQAGPDDLLCVRDPLDFFPAVYYFDAARVFIVGTRHEDLKLYTGKVLIPRDRVVPTIPSTDHRIFLLEGHDTVSILRPDRVPRTGDGGPQEPEMVDR